MSKEEQILRNQVYDQSIFCRLTLKIKQQFPDLKCMFLKYHYHNTTYYTHNVGVLLVSILKKGSSSFCSVTDQSTCPTIPEQ